MPDAEVAALWRRGEGDHNFLLPLSGQFARLADSQARVEGALISLARIAGVSCVEVWGRVMLAPARKPSLPRPVRLKVKR